MYLLLLTCLFHLVKMLEESSMREVFRFVGFEKILAADLAAYSNDAMGFEDD